MTDAVAPAPGPGSDSVAPVAIVGGGFCGAAVAFHLARAGMAGIAVFEPRPALGGGVAYSSRDPAHRINVPSDRMSLLPDRRNDFDLWLSARPGLLDAEATLPDGRRFPRRSAFGAYVADRLAPALGSGAVRHVARAVTGIEPDAGGWRLRDAGGGWHAAAAVVLAVSHPPPALPAALRPLAGHPGLVADPWAPGALDRIGARDRVLIVGTGLSMADAMASLARAGHRGPVLAVSRRGQLSRGHATPAREPFGDFAANPADTALALLARVRGEVARAAGLGVPWQAVVDAVRAQGRAIWAALPVPERRRVVRHLRPYWDTHRFRVAPQVERVIADARARGRLEVLAARPVGARAEGGSIEVALRGRDGAIRTERPDAVVVTTGPAHAALEENAPCLAGPMRAGLLRLDPSGLGLLVDARARAIGGEPARACPSLFVAGPLARGRYGELMGLPEVAVQAREVAEAVLAGRRSGDRT